MMHYQLTAQHHLQICSCVAVVICKGTVYYPLKVTDTCAATLWCHLSMFPVVVMRVRKPFKCLRVCSCFSALKREKGRCACIVSAFQECFELQRSVTWLLSL